MKIFGMDEPLVTALYVVFAVVVGLSAMAHGLHSAGEQRKCLSVADRAELEKAMRVFADSLKEAGSK